ncbi:nitrile hydratase subunit beta [Aquabacterium sp. OR-4]|uniref:nitrile hydratase subunit beta n=1 Tax=Aquabacterium sp. OR-4 TaxID=2978127 RepID=UPI0021B1AC64|nr:nitrile hydratase subunit beta [Aquabacterium sp. OR-4]MDT7837145.1 nitrile hydratase subunit beta [Aquabacterium sp. OR-4]
MSQPGLPYTSHADLGGTPERRPVQPEPEGELWHGEWEPRALALTLAMGATGQWNIDQSRSARETLPDYARLSYYQIWLAALARLLTERGLATADELASGTLQQPPRPVARVLAAADVAAALAKGSPTARPAAAGTPPPRFAVGAPVCTVATAPAHHSRVPAYARGRRGVVHSVHGLHVFAPSHAQGLGEQAQWLYTVVFDGRTLWGDEAQPGTQVSIDAWESTLEPA